MTGSYKDFVKQHYASVSHLPPKERFAKLGVMWRQQKGVAVPKARKASKGMAKAPKGMVQGAGFEDYLMLAPKVAMRGAEAFGRIKDELSSAFGDIKGEVKKATGGALPAYPRRMSAGVPPSVPVDRQYAPMTAPFAPMTPHEREVMGVRMAPARQEGYSSNLMRTGGGSGVQGAGIFSTALGMIGLGLPMEKKKRVRKGKGKQAHGAGFLSDALGSIGLGLPMEKAKGAGFLSDALGAIGLGLPPRMRDKKLGTKFTKAQKDKLHAHVAKAHGAGFADMFIKGLRLPFDAISKIPIVKDIPILKQATQIVPAVADLTGVKSLI